MTEVLSVTPPAHPLATLNVADPHPRAPSQKQKSNLSAPIMKALVKTGARRLLNWQPKGSLIIELPDGEKIRFGNEVHNDEPHIKLENYKVIFKAMHRGSIAFAEAYIDGDLHCKDLVPVFNFFIDNRDQFVNAGAKLFEVRVPERIGHFLRRNTKRGSRKNIQEHYDLGNDFYKLWLDEEMNYSSGIYTTGAKELRQAQIAKLELILELLELQQDQHILEIGCGWGAFARKAITEHKATVTGLTLSDEQLRFAKNRSRKNALAEKSDFRLQDYRDITGEFDRIVSIEMIEAVGEKHWQTYFETIAKSLKQNGVAVIQAITIDDHYYDSYRNNPDFIQRYIFPGGMLPTAKIIQEQAAKAGLKLEHTHNFGNCYAQTLRDWRTNFETAWEEIKTLGFDKSFKRKWRYYLAYCEAGFDKAMIDVAAYKFRRI